MRPVAGRGLPPISYLDRAMSNVALQLARLVRHHNLAIKCNDPVALLDLSHSLRVWCDLKPRISTFAESFAKATSFKSAIPSKNGWAVARKLESVFCYIPDGVTIPLSESAIVSIPAHLTPGDTVRLFMEVRRTESGISLKNYCAIKDLPDEIQGSVFRGDQMKRLTIVPWLGSEIVRGKYFIEASLHQFSLSRETLVRYVANEYEASHPLDPDRLQGSTDPNSKALGFLMRHQIFGIPLPYYALLSVSSAIIAVAKRHGLSGGG
jgi:hypothetical protein